jgi:Metal-dependent hydrolases of the beta-lactamase superfamily III
MALYSVQPGVKVYRDEKVGALFGCPPEVIKQLAQQKIDFPQVIVLPDTLFRSGVLQNCTEFPLYYFLFVLGHASKGERLTVVGERAAVEANRELLRLTLLGPTRDQFAALGTSPYFETLYNEARYLSVKDAKGAELPIEGFVNFLPFERGEARGELFDIRHLDRDLYTIDGVEVSLKEEGEQGPAYDLHADYAPKVPQKFGIDILGGGSGFTPGKPSSAVLLDYNSDYMLIDCPPFLEQHLQARGIARGQLKSIFLTHIHDDHCNIFPLVEFDTRLKFLGTREIYWMALKKLSLQTLYPIEEFSSYFDFVELEPYEENDFYGIKITPHYTVHSIPTIGATFAMSERGSRRLVGFGGDNKALPHIDKMVELGITPRQKRDYLFELYRKRYDLLMIDGGMGLLHGDPEDALASEADRVVFMHLEKLPEKFDATFSMALPGKRYILSESKNDAYLIKAMEVFHQEFPGISQDWIAALMNDMSIVQLNSGDIVMKQGEALKGGIYLILSGSCSVLHHDGQRLRELAVKEAGDFIGEMAVIRREKKRSASVVAKTPVILCVIDEEVYYSFLAAEGRIEAIRRMWEIRKALESLPPFSGMRDLVNERLAKAGSLVELSPGEAIGGDPAVGDAAACEGHEAPGLVVLLSGEFEAAAGSATLGDLGPGDYLGVYSNLARGLRSARAVAKAQGSALSVERAEIEALLAKTPSLQFAFRRIERELDNR